MVLLLLYHDVMRVPLSHGVLLTGGMEHKVRDKGKRAGYQRNGGGGAGIEGGATFGGESYLYVFVFGLKFDRAIL